MKRIILLFLACTCQLHADGLLSQLSSSSDSKLFAQVATYGQNIVNYLQNSASGTYSTTGNQIQDAAAAVTAAQQLVGSAVDSSISAAAQKNGQWVENYSQTQINTVTQALTQVLTKLLQTTGAAALKLTVPPVPQPKKNVAIPTQPVPSGSNGTWQLYNLHDTYHNQYTQYFYAWEMGPQLAQLASLIAFLAEQDFSDPTAYTNQIIAGAQQAFNIDNCVFSGCDNLNKVNVDIRSLTQDQIFSLDPTIMSLFIKNVFTLLIDVAQAAANFKGPTLIHFTGNLNNMRIAWFFPQGAPYYERTVLAWNKEITAVLPTVPVPPGITQFSIDSTDDHCMGSWKNIVAGRTYRVGMGGGFDSMNANSADASCQNMSRFGGFGGGGMY